MHALAPSGGCRTLVFACFLVLTAAACGDDNEGRVPSTPTAAPTATAAPPTATSTFTPTRTAAPTDTTTPTETALPTAIPTATPTIAVPADALVIASPEDGSVITTSSIDIQIELAPEVFDLDTLAVTLNDVPIEVFRRDPRGGRPDAIVFRAQLDPGPPLEETNTIVVSATVLDGVRVVTVSHDFAYDPPRASARRITDEADLIAGPLAHGRIGDFLLENDIARFIVQDVGQRDLYSVGQYGGNIIDAELRARPGLDNFLEIQPSLNVETVINAQVAEIVNDGRDGTPAILRTCGPDDTLDFVNPSTNIRDFGFQPPATADDIDYDIEACTDYILEPDRPYVQMVTTVFNMEDGDLGLFVGDWVNAAGEVEPWARGDGGIGEVFAALNGRGISYFGFGEAVGVDYSHVPVPVPDSSIPASTSLTVSGVTAILHSHSLVQALLTGQPTFTVPAGGSKSFTRYFGVGPGSAGSLVDIVNQVFDMPSGTLRGCVTVGGSPAPRARVAVGPVSGEEIRVLASHFVTGDDGCYEGTLPTGTYGAAADRTGAPFEGGAPVPPLHTVTITDGAVTEQDFALPASGRLQVSVTDAAGAAVPARVTVVGFDPSPDPGVIVPGLPGTIPDQTTGLFNDLTKDNIPFGIVATRYAGADGMVDFPVEPGDYQLFVSRGAEYSLFQTPITITTGETTVESARIARVIDTAGFISSDFHVHGINSADSRVSHTDRAMQFAGEGVDNVIMTDHHAHTDLNPRIEELGLADFVHATVGEEITTWDTGHFNGYPLAIDPLRPSGGSTDWAQAAPPGRDFVEYGAFSALPEEMERIATEGEQGLPDTVVQVNHINSHFSPLKIDTSLVPPRSLLTPEERLSFRIDPDGGEIYHHFPALELWNGSSRGAQGSFRNSRIGVWFNHLNQGLLTTAIADTDTHTFFDLTTAGARTWTASSTDFPVAIDPGEVGRAVAAGRAVGGQGLYVQTRLHATDGSGDVADLTLDGSTLVSTSNGAVDLEIHVQAPLWGEYDRIEIFANADTVVAGMNDGVPVEFGAEPTMVLIRGDDFTVETVEVAPEVPGGQRLETSVTVPFTGLGTDTWFVVLVRGSDGISRPIFPLTPNNLDRGSNQTLADLIDGNLGEGGVLALGFTNALYADVDGVAGFQAPRAPAP